MATLDLSAEGISMLYLHCNELQKEYVLAVEATGKNQKEQIEEVNAIVRKTNKYLEAFTWLYIQLVEEKPEEYILFYNSLFKKRMDALYQPFVEKYEMYREYVNRTLGEKK